MKNNDDILSSAISQFDESYRLEFDNRRDAEMTSQFIDGNQWPETMKDSRRAQRRPCLTINKLRKYILQVLGELQQNRPGLKVRPMDDQSDIPGAMVRDDLIRHIEFISTSDVIYDTALLSALEGGYGYWRIVTEYDNESFDQNIILKRIPNRFSVILDQTSEMPSYEDGRYAFVMKHMSRDKFQEMYPDHDMTPFTEINGMENWFTENNITIAEYFWKETETVEIWKLEDGTILKPEDIEKIKDTTILEDILATKPKKRIVEQDKIYWAKMTGNSILEGPTKFPGTYIPIVPMLGYEFNDNGSRRFRGLIYDSIDAVRMYNYWKTYNAESIALSPKTPYMLTAQQIEGHQAQWDVTHLVPSPYILYNHIPGEPPPIPKASTPPPIASINEANSATNDIQDTIGLYASNMGQPSNERSGRAILARQKKGDNTTYTFVNNFHNALIFSHKIILNMIPEVYDAQRIIRTLAKDGGLNELKLNFPTKDPGTLIEKVLNDMTVGRYDMVPVVGPNYATKRMETLSSMLDFIQFVPQYGGIMAPEIAKLMDWEGAEKIAAKIEASDQQQQQQQNVKNK